MIQLAAKRNTVTRTNVCGVGLVDRVRNYNVTDIMPAEQMFAA